MHSRIVSVFLLIMGVVGIFADYRGVCIVIHGTWALDEAWSKPGGDFFVVLEAQAKKHNLYCVPFIWSGKLDNESREAAGKNLAQVIRSYPPLYDIVLVGHSHGANVGILASQYLAVAQTHSIKAFYALATPVSVGSYMPDMRVITHFYNLFSFEDFVQPILGVFQRVYPVHTRIANVRVLIEGKQPGHSQLHDPRIAANLLDIHTVLAQKKVGNFGAFMFGVPGLIDFRRNKCPLYKRDVCFEELFVRDLQLQEYILNSFSRAENKRL